MEAVNLLSTGLEKSKRIFKNSIRYIFLAWKTFSMWIPFRLEEGDRSIVLQSFTEGGGQPAYLWVIEFEQFVIVVVFVFVFVFLIVIVFWLTSQPTCEWYHLNNSLIFFSMWPPHWPSTTSPRTSGVGVEEGLIIQFGQQWMKSTTNALQVFDQTLRVGFSISSSYDVVSGTEGTWHSQESNSFFKNSDTKSFQYLTVSLADFPTIQYPNSSFRLYENLNVLQDKTEEDDPSQVGLLSHNTHRHNQYPFPPLACAALAALYLPLMCYLWITDCQSPNKEKPMRG